MNNRKIVWFSAFRHLVPSDYEEWLERMAAGGWHVDRFRQWSSVFMVFQRGEPAKYRFTYDVQVSPRNDYFTTYQDFGWEYLGRMASAHIWRMKYEGQRPAAFSERETLTERNRRNIRAVSVSFFIFLAAVIAMAFVLGFTGDSLSGTDRLQVIIAEAVFGCIMLALGLVMVLLRKNDSR